MNSKELKYNVMYHYSNGTMACACCGECFSIMFLTIDHIYNDGNIHRKDLKLRGYKKSFYKYLIENGYPDAYQVLCWNCNEGKRLNKGICPHKATNVINHLNLVKKQKIPSWLYDLKKNPMSLRDIYRTYTRRLGYTYEQTKTLLEEYSNKHIIENVYKQGKLKARWSINKAVFDRYMWGEICI